MTPKSSKNLDNFKQAYEIFGCYWLAPSYIGEDDYPEIIPSHAILKREVNIKEAREIGANDFDIVLIDPKDR
jgi:hypothetical protein